MGLARDDYTGDNNRDISWLFRTEMLRFAHHDRVGQRYHFEKALNTQPPSVAVTGKRVVTFRRTRSADIARLHRS